ncbi:lytic transglycosylase domain-containing protein [Microcella sp.]|uniref:lytic transglycosylase domain-containing protein n=1 Tax=Microcella sp. TaxID=1913979 RepID=UPI002563D532|nr:lytic murein transglycosylase [Microcella sp.]MBX9472437.1 lytic murein transglycosylase [Microcella sp.]
MTPAAIARMSIGLALGALVVAALVLLLLRPSAPTPTDAALEPTATPAPRWAEPAPLPPTSAAPTRPGVSGLVDPAWVTAVAADSGIPERVLAAYAGAAISKNAERPDCDLGWNTLAGIGWVESRHGTYGGASVADDGTVSPPIIGIALDGSTTNIITDTDGGEFDGDAEFDRALGPMQFIPGSWANWYVDASGDGIADPHNIDDAALAAANYLCRAVPTLGDEASWRGCIAAYNDASSYLDAVATASQGYAAAAERSSTSQ